MRRKSKILALVLLISLVYFPVIFLSITETRSCNPGPYFSISILAPNTNLARTQWGTIMLEQLPKIGIAVDIYDLTNWDDILSKTVNYSSGIIPTFAEGGYDILVTKQTTNLFWNPISSYTSDALIELGGRNYYQYTSVEFDQAIYNYSEAENKNEQLYWINEIQQILHEDLPQIAILYPERRYAHFENLTGVDALLWDTEAQPMNNWSMPDRTVLEYAVAEGFNRFHIHTYQMDYDYHWLHQIYNGLLERSIENDRNYTTWIAESYSSADGLTYEVVIKNTAVWADGTPLTTDDIIYNYNLVLEPELGAKDHFKYKRYWDNKSITKINDKEFLITFRKSMFYQETNLALNLIPKHIWEGVAPENHTAQAKEWAEQAPEKIFGAGPFTLAEYNAEKKFIHLTVNSHFEDWSGEAPKFTDVYIKNYPSKYYAMKALTKGEVQIVDAEFNPSLEELSIPGVTYSTVQNTTVEELAINCKHPYIGTGELCPIASPESGKAIRRAISAVVPRAIFIENLLNGYGEIGITAIPPIIDGFNGSIEPHEFSVLQGDFYMRQAGFVLMTWPPDNGLPFIVWMIIPFTIIAVITTIVIIFMVLSRKRTKREDEEKLVKKLEKVE